MNTRHKQCRLSIKDTAQKSTERRLAVAVSVVHGGDDTIDEYIRIRLFMKPTFSLHSLRSYLSLSSFNNAHWPLFPRNYREQHRGNGRTRTHTIRAKCRLEQPNCGKILYPDEK